MSWKDLIKLLVPIVIKNKVPHGEELAPIVESAINEAEELKDAKGADKLQHVINEVKTGATAINTVYGREKINMQNLDNVIGNSISTVISGANVVKTSKQIVNKSKVN